jgi:hypothetical protein
MKDEHAKKLDKYVGEWRIVEMDKWDDDRAATVSAPAISVSSEGTGTMIFGSARLTLDIRVHLFGSIERIEFSFQGEKDGTLASGRGSAITDGSELVGHLYFHFGDDSGFRAERVR